MFIHCKSVLNLITTSIPHGAKERKKESLLQKLLQRISGHFFQDQSMKTEALACIMHLLMKMLTEKSLDEFTSCFRELNWEI